MYVSNDGQVDAQQRERTKIPPEATQIMTCFFFTTLSLPVSLLPRSCTFWPKFQAVSLARSSARPIASASVPMYKEPSLQVLSAIGLGWKLKFRFMEIWLLNYVSFLVRWSMAIKVSSGCLCLRETTGHWRAVIDCVFYGSWLKVNKFRFTKF